MIFQITLCSGCTWYNQVRPILNTCDYIVHILLSFQLDVKEAKKIENHPQWDISDDEEKEDNEGSETEGDSDYDDSEDDWRWFFTIRQDKNLFAPGNVFDGNLFCKMYVSSKTGAEL